MGGSIGCVLGAGEGTAEVVKDLVSRLGVTSLFLRGGMCLPALKGKAPASSPDGAAPGVRLADDDAPLKAALEAARDAGVDPYLVLSNPLLGAAGWSDLFAQCSGGGSAADVDAETPTLCPNRPKLLKWLSALAEELVKTYKPTGVLLEDFSLGSPENLDTLFMCWCDLCQARANELGYDADRIRIGMQGARSKLEEGKLGAPRPRDYGIGQYIEAIGYDTGLLDWLNFRADSVSACLYEVRQALAAKDAAVQVGVLSKGPTVSILAGQRRADVLRDTTLADFYAPVICGHASGVLATIAAHAKAVGGGDEAAALSVAAGLHGYRHLPMPGTAEEVVGSPSAELLTASAERELALAMAGTGDVPRWPAIDVAGLPGDVVAEVAGRVGETDAAGLLYVGVPG